MHQPSGRVGFQVTWSTVEAALRIACESFDVELPDYRPMTLVGRLYREGDIDRNDYDLLAKTASARNSVARGLQVSPPLLSKLEALTRFTTALLQQATRGEDDRTN